MRKRTISRGIPALLLVVVLLVQALPISHGWWMHEAKAATVTAITPSSGPPGSNATISGAPGSLPNTAIFSVFMFGLTVGGGTADGQGAFTANIQIPNIPRGTYSLTVQSGNNHAPGPYNFAVTSAISLNPASGTAGSTTTVSGAGFQAGSLISIALLGTLATAQANTSPNGDFTANILIPIGTPVASYTIQASDSVGAALATFTVTSATPTPTSTATATATVTATPTGTVVANGALTVIPTSGPPGKFGVQVTAPASTFSPNQFVTMLFTDANNNVNALPSTSSLTDGSLNVSFSLPAQATAGNATISASAGSSTATGVYFVTQTITVIPTSVAIGGQIEVIGDGYSPFTAMSFSIGFTPFNTSTPVSTNGQGHFDAILTLPASGLFPGQTGITASNSTGSQSATASFTLLPTTVTPTATLTATASATPSVTPTATPGGFNTGATTTAAFAEGYTGLAASNGKATFTEVLNILNPAASQASATITYYLQGKTTPIVVNRAIAGSSITREPVNTDVGPDQIVAAIVTSQQRLVVTRTMTRISPTGQRLDGSTTQPAGAPSTTWGFAEGYTGISYQEYLTLLNPNSSQANVTVLLAPQASSAVGARTLTLPVPAFGRITANIRALNQGNTARSVGMIVSSDIPVVAERVEYFGSGAGSGKFGSTVSQGSATATSQARFAFGSSGGSAPDIHGVAQAVGDQDYITVMNPSSQPGSIQVVANFSDAAGHAIGQPVVVNVASGTRATIVANVALGSAAVGPFSVSVNGTGPFFAESAQYFGGSPNDATHPGVVFKGNGMPSSDAFISDLTTGLADGGSVKQSLYVLNTSAAPIQVAVQYFGVAGAATQAQYTVPAGGITTINASQDTAGTVPSGPVGAEIKLAPGVIGSFMAASVGMTIDGLSATEDVGVPS